MPSYLDFNTTSNFRDFLIGRTLQQPNGPQTFTSSSYTYQNLSDFPNVDPGDVETVRPQQLLQTQTSNIFKPQQYFIVDSINTIPRRANLSLYPYFTAERHNLIGIMSNSTYTTESELFKFAATYIRDDKNGPVQARISQNLQSTTNRLRVLDAINGNTSTALNLLTGRESVLESNYQITVQKTIPGKAIDFLKTVSGVELPFSTIPGDYLSNPSNPINFRPEASTEVGRLLQDTTGALGSLLGIPRRPKRDRKPSDLFIEYMGDGQKRQLFNLLSYSKYAPNYTTTARSQNTSKIFNFVDNVGQGVKNILGIEAPNGVAYIGDDRGDDVRYAMNDFNDRPVRGTFYLSLMFDETQARLFQKTKNIGESGKISGNLTWISKNSKNKLGENNSSYNDQRSKLEESLSTKYGFREDSILGVTQEMLDSMPSNGGEARSHISNVIDQTSRVFGEGDLRISRGSAVKYVDKFSGEESGVEYCRVWTKDRPYFTMDDTMKRTSNIRKFDDSVLGGDSRVWNINIAPMSNGNKSFDGSTNIVDNYGFGGGYYAKKYMFSIENLAWKTSNKEGFTVQDLPYCERGSNGGRVMWFPPYDLKFSEQNNAKWEENVFLGRPEPIYTYQNTTRSGSISFKVIVDHPSVLNLLVREHFKNMSDEEADNYIHSFFAGCEDVDLYSLVRKYTTLDGNDLDLITRYLNNGVTQQMITSYKPVIDNVTQKKENTSTQNPVTTNNGDSKESISVSLKFINDKPSNNSSFRSDLPYSKYYDGFTSNFKTSSVNTLTSTLTNLIKQYITNPNTVTVKNDIAVLYGNSQQPITTSTSGDTVNKTVTELNSVYSELDNDYNVYVDKLNKIKTDLESNIVRSITVNVNSSTSAIADLSYNMRLSYRRTFSIVWDVLNRLSKVTIDETFLNKLNWTGFSDVDTQQGSNVTKKLSLKDLGYDTDGTIEFRTIQNGENSKVDGKDDCSSNFEFKSKDNAKNLNLHAPISVKCRKSNVDISYVKKSQQPTDTVVNEDPVVTPTTRLVEVQTPITVKPKKPPIDVMKRIIMKTLSECYYFKKLEESSPVQFSSLKEKLKYFHPAFHSMTPEGLNARLTFLQQCLRPGDTIPIKGISDDVDLTARNTSFGPPPVCVIRIGDFYNSKVIINDINISYDDSPWDLNPEGIGVQPMIANVTLQVKFIGGHGLSKPIERLQNALSSNFYANTEMYDERSISTNEKIGGKKSDDYTKEFLESLNKQQEKQVKPSPSTNDNGKPVEGYIGTLNESTSTLSYTTLISDTYTKIDSYFKSYTKSINDINKKYGQHITNLVFSPNYRTINQFDVYESANGTQTTTINLFGVYPNGKDYENYVRGLKSVLLKNIEFDISSVSNEVFNFNIVPAKIPNSDNILKPYLLTKIGELVDEIGNIKVNDLEEIRNNITQNLDKLNYMVYYVDHDATINKDKYSKATLSGYTSTDFYSKYSNTVNNITQNDLIVTNKISNIINFNQIFSITKQQAIEIILNLLSSDEKYKNEIIALYQRDLLNFRPNFEQKEIKKSLDKKLVKGSEVVFKLKKTPVFDGKEVAYKYISITDITDQTEIDTLKKLRSQNVDPTGNKLNYYKKPK